MAVLDGDASEIVIRVVYDGPPEAGKTTSLRALAGSLSQSAVSPEEDERGRTLWFDWMEYTGGRYEGCRIRCQIVSVPGQPALAARRRVLLDGADVIVCVADTRPDEWEASLAHLRRLCDEVDDAQTPAPGIVVQANKRDLPDAVDIDDVRTRVVRERPAIGIVESIAADGTGIREAFVYAVRLALDRVRDLMTRGALRTGRPDVTSSDALLAKLRGAEPSREGSETMVVVESKDDSIAASLLREVLAQEEDATMPRLATSLTADAPPQPPDTTVPSGAIWPPVEGRAILHEVSGHALAPRRLSSGDWAAGLGTGWRVVSNREAVYATLDQGRTALIHWARLHATCLSVISPRRCIVLADAGDGTWRLWQIVHAEDSLRDVVGHALREPTAERAVYRLCYAAQLLLDADRKLSSAPCVLSCNIDSVGVADNAAVYVGLMPEPGAVTEPVSAVRASRPRSCGRSSARSCCTTSPTGAAICTACSIA